MTVRDVVFLASRQALYERNRYSPAVRSDSLLFISGQIDSRDDGSPEPKLETQVRRVFDNLNAVLAAAGCGFDDVLDVTVSTVDAETSFKRIWKIVLEYWDEASHPTLTTVGMNRLYDFSFKTKVVARLPEGREGGA